VAKPGTSEHQTGLTMDISAASMNYTLDESFEYKPEGKWLAEHAHEYGFILRYPKGKREYYKISI
jgi:LAS superfamily LD-carboxypeptidase LdcB